jgi:hypothetical protein
MHFKNLKMFFGQFEVHIKITKNLNQPPRWTLMMLMHSTG